MLIAVPNPQQALKIFSMVLQVERLVADGKDI